MSSRSTGDRPRFHLVRGGDDGASPPPDPIAQARAAHLENVADMFDRLVNCGRSENERALLAMMVADNWRIPHHEFHSQRCARIREIGFAGDRPPVPILRDYSYGIDAIPAFPLRIGERVFCLPFALFSNQGVRLSVSVDDDPSPESAERDRVCAAAGWNVLRFSDAEMRRDANRVLCEIQARVNAWDWIAEAPSDPSRRAEAELSVEGQMQNYDSFARR